MFFFFNVITIYTWGLPSFKKPRTHFTSHKLIHKSILHWYAYNSTWKTIFCILIEFIFYGKLSLTSAWLFGAVCEWFVLGCWRVRPIEKLVRTGSSRLQENYWLQSVFEGNRGENTLYNMYASFDMRIMWKGIFLLQLEGQLSEKKCWAKYRSK